MGCGDAQRVPRGDHAHDQAQDCGGVRSAIDKIADEGSLASLGVSGIHRCGVAVMNHPTESGEQCAKFGGATVDVADDVEQPVDVLAVVPRLLADEFDSIDLVGAAQGGRVESPLC